MMTSIDTMQGNTITVKEERRKETRKKKRGERKKWGVRHKHKRQTHIAA